MKRSLQMIKINSIKTVCSKTLFPRLAPSMTQGGSSWRALRLINQPRIILQWGIFLRYAVQHLFINALRARLLGGGKRILNKSAVYKYAVKANGI
ncbi:MAG: hypothetical protein LBB72_08050 [Spirochaetaceae bacterium]|jgi:hypothetical protein|nr:hypothetical protein [Spirochaetaceae bacterium]